MRTFKSSVLLLLTVFVETALSHEFAMSNEQLTHEVETLKELGYRLLDRVDTLKEEKAALSSEVEKLTEEGAKLSYRVDTLTKEKVALSSEVEKLKEGAKQAGIVSELKDKVENLTQKYQTLKEENDQSVYFTAYISGHIRASAGQVIRFNRVVENTGNAYSPDTGVFTAPYDGGYMFLVSIDVTTDYGRVEIVRNGRYIVWGDKSGSQITTGAVMSLKSGDTVKVVHCCSGGHVDQGPESILVGFRVR